MAVDQKNSLVRQIERRCPKRTLENEPSGVLVQIGLISIIYVYLIVRIAHPVRSMVSLRFFVHAFIKR